MDRGNGSQEEGLKANSPLCVQYNSMAAVVWTVMLSTGMLISMLQTRKEGLWVSIPPFLLLEQSQQVFIESCSMVT